MTQELIIAAMMDLKILNVRHAALRVSMMNFDNVDEQRWKDAETKAGQHFRTVIGKNIGLVVLMRLRGDFNAWQLQMLRDYETETD